MNYMIAFVLGLLCKYFMATQVMYNVDGKVLKAVVNSLCISACVYAQIKYASDSAALMLFITYSAGAATGQGVATYRRQTVLTKKG